MVFLTGGVPRGLDTCHSPFRAVGGSLPYRHSELDSSRVRFPPAWFLLFVPKWKIVGVGGAVCAPGFRSLVPGSLRCGRGPRPGSVFGAMVSLCPFGARGFKSHSRRQPRPAFRFLVRGFSLRVLRHGSVLHGSFSFWRLLSGSSGLVSGLFPGSGFGPGSSGVVEKPGETLEKLLGETDSGIRADSGLFFVSTGPGSAVSA